MTAVSYPIPPIPAEATAPESKPVIDSPLSLELRLRWLEALILGVKQTNVDSGKHNIIRSAEDIRKRLDTVVQSNDGLRKFMDQYDQYAQYLSPAFVLSGTVPSSTPTFQDMSPAELDAYLSELEPDIRSAERDMSKIETLVKSKDVLSAGKLGDYEALQDRFQAVSKAHDEDMRRAAALEKRIAALVKQHSRRVDAMSELFVDWDDALTQIDHHITKLEREKVEKARLGMDSE